MTTILNVEENREDGKLWENIFQKLCEDLKGHLFIGLAPNIVTTTMNIARELGYGLALEKQEKKDGVSQD